MLKNENKIMIAAVSITLMVAIAAIIYFRRNRQIVAPAPDNDATPAPVVLSNDGKPSYLIGSKVRGIRNNNPGNIRLTSTPWKGKVPNAQNTDKSFEQFETYLLGTRAMLKQIIRYKTAYGIDTPAKFVSRWAPASDNNNEAAYVAQIVKNIGGTGNTKIDLENKNTLYGVANAVGWKENGVNAVPLAVFEAAYKLI